MDTMVPDGPVKVSSDVLFHADQMAEEPILDCIRRPHIQFSRSMPRIPNPRGRCALRVTRSPVLDSTTPGPVRAGITTMASLFQETNNTVNICVSHHLRLTGVVGRSAAPTPVLSTANG